jgi:hypothetical protein
MVILAIHSIYFSLFLNVFRFFVIYQPLDQQKERKHERKNWRGSISLYGLECVCVVCALNFFQFFTTGLIYNQKLHALFVLSLFVYD